MSKFIAVHAEPSAQDYIVATGHTDYEAIVEAVRRTGVGAGVFIAQPCTERLYDEVNENGTPSSWTERNGLQDLEEEEEAAAEVDYGSHESLAALLKAAAKDFDEAWDYVPTHFFAQFSRSGGWEVVFAINGDLATSMTQWDSGHHVEAFWRNLLAGNDAAAVEYAGDILGRWESEWDDE